MQKRQHDKSWRNDSKTKNKDAPNQLNSFVTNVTKECHFFIMSISFHGISPNHIIIVSTCRNARLFLFEISMFLSL